jgi:hypothetical protein
MASVIHLDGDYIDRVGPDDTVGVDSVVKKEVETAKVIESQEKDQGKTTLVLDGPLSEIYTQALNLIYGNRKYDVAHQNVGEESAANDQIMASSENKAQAAYAAGEGSVAYLYVDDGEDLQQAGLDQVVDKLRVALNNRSYSKVAVCFENLDPMNEAGHIVMDYVTQQGGQFYFSHAAAERFMRGL